MFDAITRDTIRGAPPLQGVEIDALPELLTTIHAWLATYRLSLNDMSAVVGGGAADDARARVRLLRRLTNSYELFATSRDVGPARTSAAYVAASGHQLLAVTERLQLTANRSQAELSTAGASPDLVAALLFLVAGYPSDAQEVARLVAARAGVAVAKPQAAEGDVGSKLVVDILNLAQGRLTSIVRDAQTVSDGVDQSGGGVGVGSPDDVLWDRLRAGVQALASALLGRSDLLFRQDSNYRAIFADVAEQATIRLDEIENDTLQRLLDTVAAGDGSTSARSAGQDLVDAPLRRLVGSAVVAYPGQHQIARLLLSAGDKLADDAVINVPVPPGVTPALWRGYLAGVATKRPFLWRNHLQAIRDGYLHPGTSSVVSFPTGAGKSTLSELKIAATLLSGRRVVFLAPTRALVWQTVVALRASFPARTVAESLTGDGAYHEADPVNDTPDIIVMTPEKCLMYLGSSPEALAGIGLLVFDECHLLHPKAADGSDRRSLDAMLCLLGMLDIAHDCDVLLLSAMIKNAEELSRWISSVTVRPCTSQDGGWKPTRQVRGCVVYEQSAIDALSVTARQEHRSRRGRPPLAALVRKMKAVPYTLFGLTHRWAEQVTPSAYSLLPASTEAITLALNKQGELTSNKNQVAAHLAVRLAALGVKVIVFVQNKDYCRSVADTVDGQLRSLDVERTPLSLLSREKEWLASAAEDLGGASHVISPSAWSAVHNSLLLPAERRLSESAFARDDGVQVLVATPTLAQGMNLPAEAVIIAGDGRFDVARQGNARMDAHELLNAAGRAGRAGHRAAGMVLVVPDGIVTTASDLSRVSGPWEALRRDVFSKPDQCLEIGDPVGLLLDRVEVEADNAIQDNTLRYFVTRIPIDERRQDPNTVAFRLLGRSLSAYRARTTDERTAFQNRVEQAVKLRRRIAQVASDRVQWLDRLISTSGVTTKHVVDLERSLRRAALPQTAATVAEWVDWLFVWCAASSTRLPDMISRSALVAAMTSDELAATGLAQSPEAAEAAFRMDVAAALPAIRRRLGIWMAGRPLIDIEVELGRRAEVDPICRAARTFLTRSVHEFAYVAGLVAQIFRGQIDNWNPFADDLEGSAPDMPMSLGTLAACVREGVDSPEALAVHMVRQRRDPYVSRVSTYVVLSGLRTALEPAGATEQFADLRRRVEVLLESDASRP